LKLYLITGEPSGDIHASNLVSELKKIDNTINIRAWGGENLIAQGVDIAQNINKTSYMGLWSVIKNLLSILKLISFCKKDILTFAPDALILVDYPGFNLRIAKFAKQHGIKVFYYIPPKLWAWNKKRLIKIKKYVDEVIVVFPFEKSFYKKNGIDVLYMGNPILDQIEKSNFSFNYNSSKQIIALLPGSRKQEIKAILPIMISLVDSFKNYQFVIAATNTFSKNFYNSIIGNKNIDIVFNQTYSLLKQSHAALVTSGTASLEAALLNVPQVVCYKTNILTYIVASKLINIKFLSLVNILMNRLIVKELIQYDLNVKNLTLSLFEILDVDNRKNIHINYDLLRQKIGEEGSSKKLAEYIAKNTL